MSLPEVLLWKVLRTRPDGLKFRKQQPAGTYSLDFYCHEALLAIEVDGESHDFGDRPRLDAARDKFIEGLGLQVLRVPAREVLADLEAVVAHIVATAREAIAPPPPADGGRSPSPAGRILG